MGFLIGTIVVLALVGFAIASRGFRRALGAFVVIVVIALFLLYRNAEKEGVERQRQEALQEQWATKSIHASDIALADVALTKDLSHWTLTGTVSNNSKFDLGEIRFLVTIKDCAAKECRIIGQEATSAAGDTSWPRKPLVPAGQVRLFSSRWMEFKNMPPTNNPEWEYKITEIRAF